MSETKEVFEGKYRTVTTDSSESQNTQTPEKSKIASRKSIRKRQAPRSYSPPHEDTDSTSSLFSRRKQAFPRRNPRSATAADRKFDILPNGEPFSCHLCRSPYVINRWSKHAYKDRRSKHNPTPKTKLDPKTGKEVYVCNACCVTLERRRKKKKARPAPTAEDKQRHLDQCEAFGREFVEVVGQSFAKNLFCPSYNTEPCNCLQKYCCANGDTEESLHRMREIYKLHVRAKELSKLKCYEGHRESSSSLPTQSMTESHKGPDSVKSNLQGINNRSNVDMYTAHSQQDRSDVVNSLQVHDPLQLGVSGSSLGVLPDSVQYSEGQYSSVVTHTGRIAGHLILETLPNGKKRKRRQSIVIGLGNGQKRSKAFETFVFEKRAYLKETLNLCERAVQRILCYSNNFLHKRLKTENKLSRVNPDEEHSRQSKLITMDTISETQCCIDNCSLMALTHRRLLLEWRERAQQGQAEARRVIAEMLVPSAGLRCNCYCFITMVTGVSRSTITRVKGQMLESGGDREPPAHGMKKYRMAQQAGAKKDKDKGSTQQKRTTPSDSRISSDKLSQVCPVQVIPESQPTSNAEIQRQQLLQLQQMFEEQKKQQMVLQQLLHQTLVAGPNSNMPQNEGLIQQVIDQLNVQIQNNQAQLQQSLQQLVAMGAVSLIPETMVTQQTSPLQPCPQPNTYTQSANQQGATVPTVGTMTYVPNTAPFVQDIVLTVPTSVSDGMGRHVQQQVILADAGSTPVTSQVVLQKQVAIPPPVQQSTVQNPQQVNLRIQPSNFQTTTVGGSEVNLSQPLIQYAAGAVEVQPSHDGFLQTVPHQEYRIAELQQHVPVPQAQPLSIIVQRDNPPSQDGISGIVEKTLVEHFPQVTLASDQNRTYSGGTTYQNTPVVIAASQTPASKTAENYPTSSSSAAVPNVMIVSPNSAFVTFIKDKNNQTFTSDERNKLPVHSTRIINRHPLISENLQRKSQSNSVVGASNNSDVQKNNVQDKFAQSTKLQHNVQERQNSTSSSSQNVNYKSKQILIQGTFRPISSASQQSSVSKILANVLKDSRPADSSDPMSRGRNTLMVCRKVDFGEQTHNATGDSVETAKQLQGVNSHRIMKDSTSVSSDVQEGERTLQTTATPNQHIVIGENTHTQKSSERNICDDSVMKSSVIPAYSADNLSRKNLNSGSKEKLNLGSDHQTSREIHVVQGQVNSNNTLQNSIMDSPVKQQRVLTMGPLRSAYLNDIQIHTVTDPSMLLQLLERTANETMPGKKVMVTGK